MDNARNQNINNQDDLQARIEDMAKRLRNLEDSKELLIRIDERMATLMEEIRRIKDAFVPKGEFEAFRDEILATMVTQAEFAPIQKTLYLIGTLVITGIVGGVLALILP